MTFQESCLRFIKWVLVTVGGAVAIAVVVRYVMEMIF